MGDVHPITGWVESAHIELGRTRLQVEAKADTGAATSSIHAFDIRPFTQTGAAMVRFKVVQGTSQTEVELPVARIGYVRSSEGDKERRIYVRGTICLGYARWPILFSLNDRSQMRYPVLLGRAFLRAKYVVDSGKIHALGRPDCSLSEGGEKAREAPHDYGRLEHEPSNAAAQRATDPRRNGAR